MSLGASSVKKVLMAGSGEVLYITNIKKNGVKMVIYCFCHAFSNMM